MSGTAENDDECARVLWLRDGRMLLRCPVHEPEGAEPVPCVTSPESAAPLSSPAPHGPIITDASWFLDALAAPAPREHERDARETDTP